MEVESTNITYHDQDAMHHKYNHNEEELGSDEEYEIEYEYYEEDQEFEENQESMEMSTNENDQEFEEEEEDEEDLDFNDKGNEDNEWSEDDIDLNLDYSELMILRQTTDSSMMMAQTSTPHDTDFKGNTPQNNYNGGISGLGDLQPLSRQSSTKSQTPSTQYWSCLQCNQLNNLVDTIAKYDMKCWRCDSLYEVKSKVIMIEEEIEEPLKTTWKCPQCTLINPNEASECEVCEFTKPPQEEEISESEDDTAFAYPSTKRYTDEYSGNLVRGYLRAICSYYLDQELMRDLCPKHSTIPDVLSIVVLQFYQFCNFWNMEYLSDHWKFDEGTEENLNNKSTLIRTNYDNYEWKNAFSLQKVQYLGNYSWTLQIQYVNPEKVKIEKKEDKYAKCWIGVIESNHDSALSLRAWNNQLFCASKFGYGIYGFNGTKMKNNVSKPFCKPFKVNDIVTIKLECTMSYYELRYTVNGRDIGNYNAENDDKDEDDKKKMEQKEQENKDQDNDNDNSDNDNDFEIQQTQILKTKKETETYQHINRHDRVAYRLPNDKVYEMVIALKNPIYKIKCISFQTKPFSYY